MISDVPDREEGMTWDSQIRREEWWSRKKSRRKPWQPGKRKATNTPIYLGGKNHWGKEGRGLIKGFWRK